MAGQGRHRGLLVPAPIRCGAQVAEDPTGGHCRQREEIRCAGREDQKDTLRRKQLSPGSPLSFLGRLPQETARVPPQMDLG